MGRGRDRVDRVELLTIDDHFASKLALDNLANYVYIGTPACFKENWFSFMWQTDDVLVLQTWEFP